MRIDLQFFGGRGADLPTGTAGGGGGGGKFGDNPNIIESKTLKEALGKKGRPMSITNAVKGANPYYAGGYAEYNENCQRCVVAYEARRRGYNVIAMPTYSGDKLPRRAGGLNSDNHFWQGAFKKAKVTNVGAKTADGVKNNIDKKMKEWGNRSRAVVAVQWKNGDGHVFNVERVGGKTMYVDAQVGVKYEPKQILSVVKPNSVRLIRTDNLRFSERAKKSIETKGKRR